MGETRGSGPHPLCPIDALQWAAHLSFHPALSSCIDTISEPIRARQLAHHPQSLLFEIYPELAKPAGLHLRCRRSFNFPAPFINPHTPAGVPQPASPLLGLSPAN